MTNEPQSPSILFLCTGNSCRSQMAEGWARALRADVLEPYSAGITKHGLNPYAVKVMQEAGVDISAQRSQTVDELERAEFDYVITVCAHADENCPHFAGATQRVHVPFDDPPRLAQDLVDDAETLPIYRKVRDEIRQFIEKLPGNLPKAT